MKAREELFQAVRDGNATGVRELLERHPGLARTEAILHAAARVPGFPGDGGGIRPEYKRDAERAEVARLLLRHGADANARTERLGTPLHLAARYDLRAVAEALLRHGAEVNARDIDGATPLQRAISLGHRTFAELLLVHGADPAAAHRQE